ATRGLHRAGPGLLPSMAVAGRGGRPAGWQDPGPWDPADRLTDPRSDPKGAEDARRPVRHVHGFVHGPAVAGARSGDGAQLRRSGHRSPGVDRSPYAPAHVGGAVRRAGDPPGDPWLLSPWRRPAWLRDRWG